MARSDPKVRYIHRIGRRGLSSAVVEGMLSSSAPYLAVIDADLQHDETLLPDMLAVLRGGEADVVVGSRYVEGGGMGEWDASRQLISRTATRIAKLIIRADLTDPMSGFFMLTREAFAGSMRNLSGQGYKILLDIFASHPETLRLRELPYEFRTRQHGESAHVLRVPHVPSHSPALGRHVARAARHLLLRRLLVLNGRRVRHPEDKEQRL